MSSLQEQTVLEKWKWSRKLHDKLNNAEKRKYPRIVSWTIFFVLVISLDETEKKIETENASIVWLRSFD